MKRWWMQRAWLPLVWWFAEKLITWASFVRDPDFIIGGHDDPYMLRWWLFGRLPDPNAKYGPWRPRSLLGIRPYLHCIVRSDDDRALHDHPNASIGICLRGYMTEHTIEAGGVHRRRLITPGMIRFRRATFAHRLEIQPGQRCWTLFVFFGPRRDWGFHCSDRGWVHWKDFTAPGDAGQVGPGCDA
jgi:hypothetical protein